MLRYARGKIFLQWSAEPSHPGRNNICPLIGWIALRREYNIVHWIYSSAESSHAGSIIFLQRSVDPSYLRHHNIVPTVSLVQEQIPIQFLWPFIVYYWGLHGQRKKRGAVAVQLWTNKAHKWSSVARTRIILAPNLCKSDPDSLKELKKPPPKLIPREMPGGQFFGLDPIFRFVILRRLANIGFFAQPHYINYIMHQLQPQLLPMPHSRLRGAAFMASLPILLPYL